MCDHDGGCHDDDDDADIDGSDDDDCSGGPSYSSLRAAGELSTM
jgi:hypothetical protein